MSRQSLANLAYHYLVVLLSSALNLLSSFSFPAFVLLAQGAGAPTVGQVVSGSAYPSANSTVVTPVQKGVILLPEAYVDGIGSVTGVDVASAYDVYLVGQDNYTSPNTMTSVCEHGTDQLARLFI